MSLPRNPLASISPLSLSHRSRNLTESTSFRGHVIDLAKTYNGCRLLQQAILQTPSTVVGEFLFEIRAKLPELMMDPFGNYVIQRLIEMASHEQRMEIVMMNTRYDVGDTRAAADCRNRTECTWYAVHSVPRRSWRFCFR